MDLKDWLFVVALVLLAIPALLLGGVAFAELRPRLARLKGASLSEPRSLEELARENYEVSAPQVDWFMERLSKTPEHPRTVGEAIAKAEASLLSPFLEPSPWSGAKSVRPRFPGAETADRQERELKVIGQRVFLKASQQPVSDTHTEFHQYLAVEAGEIQVNLSVSNELIKLQPPEGIFIRVNTPHEVTPLKKSTIRLINIPINLV